MMKTITCFFALLLCTQVGRAQQKVGDSLLLVKDYLLEIKAAIPANSEEVTKKMTSMQVLIRKSAYYQAVLDRQLSKVLFDNGAVKKEVLQQFDQVVQSAALLRSDLQQSPFGDTEVQNELQYLQKNLPASVDKLSEYSKKATTMPEPATP